jgi:hypothetical protein
MFAADPDEVKARVESLDWVDSAQVQRLWPNTIRVEIIKRRAIARWQENGSVTLIDEAGERVHDSRGIDSSHLPLIVGRGAGPAAQSVLSALDEMPEIRSRLRALVRVGDRRWDARLAGGVSVALPEAYPERALAALTADRERLDQRVVELRALLDLLLELTRPRAELVVRELLDLGLELVDRVHARLDLLQLPLVARAEDLLEKGLNHREASAGSRGPTRPSIERGGRVGRRPNGRNARGARIFRRLWAIP